MNICFLLNILHIKSRLGFFSLVQNDPLGTTAVAFLCLNYSGHCEKLEASLGYSKAALYHTLGINSFVLLTVIGLLTQSSLLATSRTVGLVLIVAVYSTSYILL